MRRLTVLYDAGCRVCRAAQGWLEQQPAYVELEFVAAGSDEAAGRFPGLRAEETLNDLTVVDDAGGVYRGAPAWVMCLWALQDYRRWAVWLAAPDKIGLARGIVAWVSRHRGVLGLAR